VPEIVTAGPDTAVLGIGISFESNAHLAAIYADKILRGVAKAGELNVGIVSPPDISISFLKARAIGMRVPFDFFETASFVYDYDGRPVRTVEHSAPAN
jgi:putative ABC transport system substrate-binding protein